MNFKTIINQLATLFLFLNFKKIVLLLLILLSLIAIVRTSIFYYKINNAQYYIIEYSASEYETETYEFFRDNLERDKYIELLKQALKVNDFFVATSIAYEADKRNFCELLKHLKEKVYEWESYPNDSTWMVKLHRHKGYYRKNKKTNTEINQLNQIILQLDKKCP